MKRAGVDRMLTIKQLAEKWGWSMQKLGRLVTAKAVPHVRIGRRNNDIHFIESEVEAWLEARRVPVAADEARAIAQQIDRAAECKRLGIPVDHPYSS